MKELASFTLGKLDQTNLKFHYLRVGNAAPLLDTLRDYTKDSEIEWVYHEVTSLREYHFGPSYVEQFDGAILNFDIDEDNVADVRKEFWEQFIWKTNENPQLVAIIHPDSSQYGSLTRAQLTEAFSLVRLSDRPFELFEGKKDDIPKLVDWLTSMASVVHRKPKEKEE